MNELIKEYLEDKYSYAIHEMKIIHKTSTGLYVLFENENEYEIHETIDLWELIIFLNNKINKDE